MSYDAFISYSHAADGLLAPRLQSGLQRFAKGMFQRRAIRVFRDESSLSANPHLWSSITDALDQSEWFVLLLSPDAAASPWVNDEVAYWLEHKDKARILPVVTEGEFGPDILPPALTFDDEPRWVDLRFARTEEQLDLKNPTFSAAVADIASAVRGIPKDELESEEVKQHRRTIRTAWAGGIAVLVLAVAAAFAAVIASGERDHARSRELAASAVSVLAEDPELSLLLALEAAGVGGEFGLESRKTLRSALSQHRVLHAFDFEGPRIFSAAGVLNPSGDLIAIHGQSSYLEVRSLSTPNDVLWAVEYPRPDSVNLQAFFDTTGTELVTVVGWWPRAEDPAAVEPPPPNLLGIYRYVASTGELIAHYANEGPCRIWTYRQTVSPFIDLSIPLVAELGGRLDPQGSPCDDGESTAFWLVDPLTGEVSNISPPTDALIHMVTDDGDSLVEMLAGQIRVIDLKSGDERHSLSAPFLSLPSPSADVAIAQEGAQMRVVSLKGTEASFPFTITNALFTETSIVIANDGQSIEVIDRESLSITHSLRGHDGSVSYLGADRQGDLVASGSQDGTVRVWRMTGVGESNEILLASGYKSNASLDIVGSTGVVVVYPEADVSLFDQVQRGAWMTEPAEASVEIIDFGSGRVIATVTGTTGKVARVSPDESTLAVQTRGPDGGAERIGLFDAETGQMEALLPGLCEHVPGHVVSTPCSGAAIRAVAIDLDWSADGSMLAMAGGDSQRLIVWDVDQRERLFTSRPIGQFPQSAVQFSPDGEHVVIAGKTGTWIYETNSWSQVAFHEHIGTPTWVALFTPDGKLMIEAAAHTGDLRIYEAANWQANAMPVAVAAGQTRDMAMNRAGDRIALASNDGTISIVDLPTLGLVDVLVVPEEDITNVEFLSDGRLLVIPEHGDALILFLDIELVFEEARARVTRGFTDQECSTYRIDPCPTLEEIRAGS